MSGRAERDDTASRPVGDAPPAADILFIQTADPFFYRPMLAVTSHSVTSYCRRHGFGYEAFIGVKRGCWPWQAAYNRIVQLHELRTRGYRGWVVHVDADAWVNDATFDLRGYLAGKTGYAVVMSSADVSGLAWDINNGVMLVDLGSAAGQRLVDSWYDDFMAIPDAVLEASANWSAAGDDDQDLLQNIIRREPSLAAKVLVESPDLLNSRRARFIRQHLRSDTSDLDRRIENIALEVNAALAQGPAADRPPVIDDRALRALRHQIHHAPTLVEAPAATPMPDAITAAAAFWRTCREEAVPDRFQPLVDALQTEDGRALRALFANFGRSSAAHGLLGGSRQHRRVADEPGFARLRALRTLDGLLSSAETFGALDVESPDGGPWGFHAKLSPATLLARIGAALGREVRPPTALGGFLGLDAGAGHVLHLRMVEALYSAWRVRQWQALLGLERVVEVGGGIGLCAAYAARLGADRYGLLGAPVLGVIQAYLLTSERAPSGVGPVIGTSIPPADMLFSSGALSALSTGAAVALLRSARERGARAFLAEDHEVSPSNSERSTVRALVAEAGGFRSAHRAPHAVRPGFVEELFLAV